MKSKLIPIIMIISTLGLVACGGDSSSNANENTPEENIPSTNAGNSSSSSTESSLETDPVKPSSVKTGSLTDERDGQTYKTVQIGNQIWMAENLKLEVSDGFCYGDVKDNCEKYGTFYTAKTALRICPEGWKLPNDEAWKILAQNIGAEYDRRSGGGTFIYINDDAISKIRSTTGWSNTNGTNALGFSAYPAGKFNGTQYSGLGEQAAFMGSNKSSDEDDSWAVISENQIYITGGKVTNSAMPVRCLQELPCDDSNIGEVKGVTICEKGEWRLGTDAEIAVGFKTCNMENKDEIFNSCICDGYSWRKGTDAEIATEFKTCDTQNASEVINGFICENNEWREGTAAEKASNFKQCTLDNNGEVLNGFICEMSEWNEGNELEKEIGFCRAGNNRQIVDNYICVNQKWKSLDSVYVDSRDNQIYEKIYGRNKQYFVLLYNNQTEYTWDEAMTSCPTGWSPPSSNCSPNSPPYTPLGKTLQCSSDISIKNIVHWTSSEADSDYAFAGNFASTYTGNFEEYVNYGLMYLKSEKNAAVCVKD